jgi:hypothetical protein
MVRSLGPQYADLLPKMRTHLPAGFRIREAHHCDYNGRRYTHVIATNKSDVISLLITKRMAGDPARSGSARAAPYSVAGFQTREYFIYLVSDLDSGENSAILNALIPEVSQTIRALETRA